MSEQDEQQTNQESGRMPQEAQGQDSFGEQISTSDDVAQSQPQGEPQTQRETPDKVGSVEQDAEKFGKDEIDKL